MKFTVVLDKTSQYTDVNGVTWWSDRYEGVSPLDVYSHLVGQEFHGCIEIVNVWEEDSLIKAIVEADGDLSGAWLCPKIIGTLDEDKYLISISSEKTTLSEECPITFEPSVEGLQPLTLLEGK